MNTPTLEKVNQELKTYDQIVMFRIGKESFGAKIERVKEIIRYPSITTIPRAPDFLAGITNLRGQVLPVIDARVMLGIDIKDITESTRILVIDSHNSQTGIIVDSVNGVISLEEATIEPPPPAIELEIDAKYVKNIIKRRNTDSLIMELDIDLITSFKTSQAKEHRESLFGSKESSNLEEIKESVKESQLVTFIISDEEYSFPIESVREVLRVGYITEVPEVQPYVLGVLSVRDTLLPVIDIRKLFNLPSLAEDIKTELDNFDRMHTVWLRDITNALTTGATLTDELNLENCDFGKWLEDFRTSSEELARLIQSTRYDHIELHRRVKEVNKDELNQLGERLSIDIEKIKDAIETAVKEDQKILVVEIKGLPVGFLVDRMQQVIRVSDKLIEPPPSVLATERTKNLKGILKLDEGKRLVLILDEEKLIDIREIEKIEKQDVTLEEDTDREVSIDEIQVITFRVGNEEFGIDIESVREINRLDKITSIPRSPSFIKGIMNLRGNVIPVIDLRERFCLERTEYTEAKRVIIVEIGNKLTGLLVDSVSEVLRISKRDIESPPEIIETDVNMEFIRAIGKTNGGNRIILIIDVEKILNSEEKQELENTEKEYLKDSTEE
jgi:purine-binding chemotaxis protein CheW